MVGYWAIERRVVRSNRCGVRWIAEKARGLCDELRRGDREHRRGKPRRYREAARIKTPKSKRDGLKSAPT